MESVYCDGNIEIFMGDKYPSEQAQPKEHHCACGRTVCCGKHKGCCSAKKERKIHFIKERDLS